jgi:hypothetical protein
LLILVFKLWFNTEAPVVVEEVEVDLEVVAAEEDFLAVVDQVTAEEDLGKGIQNLLFLFLQPLFLSFLFLLSLTLDYYILL